MKTKISRMVGLLTIPFLIFAMLAISIMAVQAAPSVSLSPANTAVNQSDTVSVSININPDGNQVKGVELKLKFAPNVVQLDSVNIGSLLGSSPKEFINTKDDTNGELHLAYTVKEGNPAVTASGTFATLNFKVKSNAPVGISNLDLTMAVLSDSAGMTISGVVPNDGTLTVGPGATATATATATPTVTATPPPTLSVNIIPGTKTVNPSDTFSVGVIVNPLGKQVKGVELKLKSAPNVVELDSVNIGSFLGSSPKEFVNTKNNTNGELHLAYTVKEGNPAVTASGTFATLNFKVKSNAPAGASNLDLTMAVLSDSDGNTIPGVAMNDGQVTVVIGPLPPEELKWKFISVPYLLNNSNVNSVMQGINYTELYEWDPVGKTWISPVTNFVPLKGYLIKMETSKPIVNLEKKSGAFIPPSLGVTKGWNLIGTSGATAMDAETMLQAIDDSYYSIWNWDVANQRYDPVVGFNTAARPSGSVGTNAFTMQPGISYWVWATKDASLPAIGP